MSLIVFAADQHHAKSPGYTISELPGPLNNDKH